MSQGKSNGDAIAEAIHQRATVIVQLPPERREARYQDFRAAYVEAVLNMGASRQVAEEHAAKMEEFTRSLVRIIEQAAAAETAEHKPRDFA
jgi:hypothetical protein